jgi:hypothetical protein
VTSCEWGSDHSAKRFEVQVPSVNASRSSAVLRRAKRFGTLSASKSEHSCTISELVTDHRNCSRMQSGGSPMTRHWLVSVALLVACSQTPAIGESASGKAPDISPTRCWDSAANQIRQRTVATKTDPKATAADPGATADAPAATSGSSEGMAGITPGSKGSASARATESAPSSGAGASRPPGMPDC